MEEISHSTIAAFGGAGYHSFYEILISNPDKPPFPDYICKTDFPVHIDSILCTLTKDYYQMIEVKLFKIFPAAFLNKEKGSRKSRRNKIK